MSISLLLVEALSRTGLGADLVAEAATVLHARRRLWRSV
jgi:hypothetical protein